MEERQYTPAALTPELESRLKSLEQEFRDITRENIVLVAYQEKRGHGQKAP